MKHTKRISGNLAILDQISLYQFVTKAGIVFWIHMLRALFRLLLKSTGRVALSSGDFLFLINSWQGPLILFLGLASLFICVALDLNAKIIMSGKILKGQKDSVWQNIKEGFLSMGKLFNPRGIWIIIYISLIAPLVGVGFSISLTENFYIPTFITSVIYNSPVYAPLYLAGMAFFTIFGISNIFILHGILLDGKSVKEAGIQSKKLMKAHWKDYFHETLRFLARMTLILILVILVLFVIPAITIRILAETGRIGTDADRFLSLFFFTVFIFCMIRIGLLEPPLYILEVTRRFYMYKSGEKIDLPEIEPRRKWWQRILTTVVIMAGFLLLSGVMTMAFDSIFPSKITTNVIAHRAGGFEAPENTVAGLEASWKAGAYGAEIDIQRTSDGYYIVNHDNTFKRVAGVNKEPSQMTLEEVKKLKVGGEPDATFEEILEGSRGRLILFTELKGKTADIRMAEDAVRIIKERGMEDETVIISLKYSLIDYIETHYPEIQTGYLAFASFGNTAALNCDYLALEEELATLENIASIHENGRKVLIWTANTRASQEKFLRSRADAIITDQVVQAEKVISELEARTDFERIMDVMDELLE